MDWHLISSSFYALVGNSTWSLVYHSLSDQLFGLTEDLTKYLKYVSVLCRACRSAPGEGDSMCSHWCDTRLGDFGALDYPMNSPVLMNP